MSGQPTPPLITEAFGVNADAGTITNPIPLTTSTPGAASFDKGFSSTNMTPIVGGGIPPFGQDMNGILYMLSSQAAYQQAGQPFKYNSTIATAISGYAVGTILGMADGEGIWVNTVDGNTTDPDNDGTAANWLPQAIPSEVIVNATGGTVTLAPSQWKHQFIILEGTLTSNLTLVLPPIIRPTYIVNILTSGGPYTVSVIATAQSAPAVDVPFSGEGSPTAVWSDGANYFTLVPPITLPTDVGPTANTIPLRNNTGQIFASYFNQNSSPENPAIAYVFVDQGDGYFRKISLANFEIQLELGNIPGQVTNGQVPRGAVSQFFAGTVQAAQGTEVLPDGTIIKWGSVGIGDVIAPTGGTITFPTPFPNAIYQAYLIPTDTNTPNNFTYIAGITNAPTVTGFTWGAREIASATQNAILRWWAVGK